MSELLSMIFQAAILIAIPFITSRLVDLVLEKMVHQEFFQVPIVGTLARLQGMLTALLVVWLGSESHPFYLEQVLLPEGPWDLTVSEFVLERANIFVYDPLPIIRLLGAVPRTEGLVTVLIMVALPLLVLMLSLRLWDSSRQALQSFFASAILALWMGWVTLYLICLACWAFHLLNFWSLVLLVLYIQYWTSKRESAGWWPW